MRQPGDALNELWAALSSEPWRHDFFMTLRRIECLHPDQPRLGTAARPRQEPVRLGQTPSLEFAPAAIDTFTPATPSVPPKIGVRFFGLFGPNGPMPLHLTEYVLERLHDRDPSLSQFADMFHHRLLLFFYRAWAQAQPTVGLDRPGDDRFGQHVASLIGYGAPSLQARQSVPDRLRLHFAGLYAARTRNADGLCAILAGYIRETVFVQPFVGHWLELPVSERTQLSHIPAPGQQLGVGVVLGSRVWDRQHRFRIRIGPVGLEPYEALLPGGETLKVVVDLVRGYLCEQLDWELQLLLHADEVPGLRLGRAKPDRHQPPAKQPAQQPPEPWRNRLGWTTWLGSRNSGQPAVMTLAPERLGRRVATPMDRAVSPAASSFNFAFTSPHE